ncbi:MAG: cellulose biosynthesis cyclic di-GMP-binding regulatory protein BcsB [Anaerolineae bacterium]|nr:cellulose biosynthesis cyclic di-GMP-binding regulatory protein BcsB [Anaerolineae bacterium]
MMKKFLYRLGIVGIALSFMITHTSQGYAQSEKPVAAGVCSNLLTNGDFEASSGWNLTSSELPAQYSPLAYSGNQSLLLGLESQQVSDTPVWSAARQTVALSDDTAITLSFRYRVQSDPNPGDDRFFVALLDEDDEVIETLIDDAAESGEWQLFSQAISPNAAEPLQIYFGVENDGLDGATQVLVDDVQLCPSATIGSNQPAGTTEVVTASPSLTETTTVIPVDDEAVVDFELLGVESINLESPFGRELLRFSLPPTWQPAEGAELQLDLTMLVNNLPSLDVEERVAPFQGSLQVLLNKKLLTSIMVSENDAQTITIPLPPTAFESTRSDGQQELDFALKADINCGTAHQMTVVVQPTSRFIIPHQIVSPPTDLRWLPKPIYQEASFLPDTAVLIVPEEPTSDQMQAALSVAAGFGQMTRSKLELDFMPVDQLTADIQENNHLIFVGDAAALPILEEVTLPAPSDGTQFEADGADPDDGIIQMAVSPWSDAHVVLVVGGNSDTAVVKAAQAVSSGFVRVGTQNNLALVAQIHPGDFVTNPNVVDRTFAELGYDIRQVNSQGTNYIEYNFNVPPGYIGDPEAYLDLVMNHSALLDYEQSGLSVRLNNISIGSVRFGEEFTSPNQIRFSIPRSALLPGKNELEFRAELEPSNDCINPNIGGLWLTIWPESLLHLPLNPAPGEIKLNLELHQHPDPFVQNSSLGSTAFVLPSNNPVAWRVAAQLAFELGDKSDTVLADIRAFYGDDIPEDVRQTRHTIIVGRPSQLPIIQTLNDVMPVTFDTSSDIASERQMRVSYRLPPEVSLGYLQLFPSPWSKSHLILTVLGSTDQGVEWAGRALLEPDLRGNLANNLAIISDEQIINGEPQPQQSLAEAAPASAADTPAVADTNTTADTGEVADTTEIVEADESALASTSEDTADAFVAPDPETIEVENVSSASVEGHPSWILPLLGGSLGLSVLILLIALISGWRKRRVPSLVKQNGRM